MSEIVLTRLKPIQLRFTEEQRRQISAARKYRAQTFQTFGQLAVMAEVRRTLDEMRQSRAGRRADREEEQERRRVSGLGVRERLAAARERELEEVAVAQEGEPPRAAPQQTVTVRVEAAPGSIDVRALARGVATAPRSARRLRLEEAVEEIRRSARSAEDGIALATQLDDEIRKIDGRPTSTLDRLRARRGAK